MEGGSTLESKNEEERNRGDDRLRSVLWNSGRLVWNQMTGEYQEWE